MDQPTDSNDSQNIVMPLWVVVTRGVQSESFEVEGHSRRTIVIGSGRHADIRLCDSQVAPEECYLTREGDEFWLVPRGRGNVRIDSVAVHESTRLWRRCSLEVGGHLLVLRIREEPPTSPDHERPDLLAVPSDRISVSEIVSVGVGGIGGLEASAEQPFAPPSVSNPGDVGPATWPSLGTERASHSRVVEGELPPALTPGWGMAVTGSDSFCANQPPIMASIPREPSLGFSPALPVWTQASPALAPRIAAHRMDEPLAPPSSSSLRDWGEAPPSSTSPAVVSVRLGPVGPVHRLEQLGLLTQRRPGLVAGGVIIGACIIAGLMQLSTQVAGALYPGFSAATTVPLAAPLPTLEPFCGGAAALLPARSVAQRSARSMCEPLRALRHQN
jgi:hypothetical protein